nr:hypothetical protein [Rubrobacter marinus]
MPEPDEPERLLGDLDPLERAPLPLAALQGGVGHGDLPGDREHQPEGLLGRRDRVALRGVGDDDPALRRRLDVYVVHADAGSPDRLEVLRPLDDLCGDLRGAPDDEPVVLADGLQKLLRREAQGDVDLELPPQKLDPALGEGLGDENLRHAVTPVFEKTRCAAPTPRPSSTG